MPAPAGSSDLEAATPAGSSVPRHRIQDGQVIDGGFQRPVDGSVGVDPRIALVARHLVVEVRLRVGPIPHADDDVALRALRPRRRRWHLACLAMRSVQSANIANARGRPRLLSWLLMLPPFCPDCTRRSHASFVEWERAQARWRFRGSPSCPSGDTPGSPLFSVASSTGPGS